MPADLSVLTALVQSAEDAIVTIDEQQKIVLFNDVAEQLFRYRRDDVIGRPLDILIPEQSRERHTRLVSEFGQEQTTWRRMSQRRDLAALTAEGEQFTAAITIMKTTALGQPMYTAVIRDVTSADRAEALIRALFEGSASATGPEFLATAVEAVADALQIDSVVVSTPLPNRPGWHCVVDGISGGRQLDPTEFQIIRTSDRSDVASDVLFVPDDFTVNGPAASVAQRDNLVWLAMIGLVGSDGSIVGHLGLGHTTTTHLTQAERQSLHIFGARIAGELERLRKDAELRTYVDLRERIVASGPFGVMYSSLVSPTRWSNDRAVEIFGRTFTDGNPTPWDEVIHPDDLAEFRRQHAILRQSGEPLALPLRIIRPTGEIRWLRMHGAAGFDDDGRPCEITAFVVDRTEEHEATEALEAQNVEFKGSLDAFSDIRFRLDANGTILGVRAGTMAPVIAPIDEVVGSPIADRYPPHVARRVLAAISSTLEGQSTPPIRFTLAAADRPAHYEARFAALSDDSVLMVLRDAADLHLLEDQLVHAGAMQSIGRLAGGIAHDFNNVLHVIRGHAAALDRHPDDADATKRRIGAITRAVDRTSSLIDRLMRISRPETYHLSPSPLDEFLESLGLGLPKLVSDDIELFFEFDAAGRAVMIDDSQFENVILNLVANASDAMPARGTITISTSSIDAHTVEIVVADTGQGMDADTAALVFEPFFTTKTPELGTGLGLATSYSTITEAGGSMSVRSELGAGTTFTIRLPAVSLTEKDTSSAITQPPPTPSDARILIVEDEPDVLELCADLLRHAGYDVVSATDGERALSLLDSGWEVDLLLTDVVMPRVSGPELATRVQERLPGLPVIFMSGYASEVHAERLGWGTEHILRKPFSDDELLAAVHDRLVR